MKALKARGPRKVVLQVLPSPKERSHGPKVLQGIDGNVIEVEEDVVRAVVQEIEEEEAESETGGEGAEVDQGLQRLSLQKMPRLRKLLPTHLVPTRLRQDLVLHIHFQHVLKVLL